MNNHFYQDTFSFYFKDSEKYKNANHSIINSPFPKLVSKIDNFIEENTKVKLQYKKPPFWHYGVYGACISSGKLLATFSTSDVYTDVFTLPGGTPDAGEIPIATLKREIKEEVGAKLISHGDWKSFSLRIDQTSYGRPINFLHLGVYCLVELENIDFNIVESSGTKGAAWIDLSHEINDQKLGEPVKHVMKDVLNLFF